MAAAASGRPARSGNSVGHRHDALTLAVQNLANLLTAARLVCAVPLPLLIWWEWHMTAFGLFLFAALSDVADGYVAKRFSGCSALGTVLDPAADKLLVGLSLIALALVGAVPVWLVLLVVGRDLLMVIGVLLLRRRVRALRVEPLVIGKLCTFMQLFYVGVVLGTLAGIDLLADQLPALALLTAGITVLSALVYLLSAAGRLGASS